MKQDRSGGPPTSRAIEPSSTGAEGPLLGSATVGPVNTPKEASEPTQELLECFLAEGQEMIPDEVRFIDDLERLGFELRDGRLRLELPVEIEILVYPGIEGGDGWCGAAARMRPAGGAGSFESLTGSYREVSAAVKGWLRRLGRR